MHVIPQINNFLPAFKDIMLFLLACYSLVKLAISFIVAALIFFLPYMAFIGLLESLDLIPFIKFWSFGKFSAIRFSNINLCPILSLFLLWVFKYNMLDLNIISPIVAF